MHFGRPDLPELPHDVNASTLESESEPNDVSAFMRASEAPVAAAIAACRNDPDNKELMFFFVQKLCAHIRIVCDMLGAVFTSFQVLSDDALLAKTFTVARAINLTYIVPKNWPSTSDADMVAAIEGSGTASYDVLVVNAMCERVFGLVMRAHGFEATEDADASDDASDNASSNVHVDDSGIINIPVAYAGWTSTSN
jgi:hypothetical protein